MKRNNPFASIMHQRMGRLLLFPVSIGLLYGIAFIFRPETALAAVYNSARIFVAILMPLFLVFVLMTALHIFLKPAHMTAFLAKGTGLKGIILAAVAGIISTGPIYAWYPMLKTLKEKGLNNFLIAVFLGNRAVKPFLLPVMISIFGWIYVLILLVLTVVGSIGVGWCVEAWAKDPPQHTDNRATHQPV